MFSVIIPTLQKSPELREVVRRCAAHPAVAEVLVVNNAPEPLGWTEPKMRVLQQSENIYVNPAWNLGAREARGDLLAIVNDDVLFEPEVLDECRKVLRRGLFAVIGPGEACFEAAPRGRIGHQVAPFFSFKGRFGTFMAMRREDYVEIPEQLRIWGGDDWLLMQQRRPNAVLTNTRFVTDMGTTSSSPEFRALRERELTVARRVLNPLYRSRWWHRPIEYLDRLRRR